MAKKLNRLLITGASGALGSHCRQHLKDIARIIRVTDKLELTKSEANQSEEVINCDLSDYEAVLEVTKGCDGILHFGGQLKLINHFNLQIGQKDHFQISRSIMHYLM